METEFIAHKKRTSAINVLLTDEERKTLTQLAELTRGSSSQVLRYGLSKLANEMLNKNGSNQNAIA
jgi:hypothetical protein